MIRQGQSVIQGLRHTRQNFDLFCIHRAINNAGAAVLQCAQSWYKQLGQLLRSSVLQCAQSWYQQLGQLFRRVILRRPGVLLPVSINPIPQSPCLESRGSVLVPADSPKEIVAEEEIEETTTGARRGGRDKKGRDGEVRGDRRKRL